jgi:hypothetical protein
MQLGDKSDGYLQLNENRRDGRYYEYLGHYYYKGHNIYNVNFTPTG